MARSTTVVTAENIEVTYQLAGFASRFLAAVVDIFIQLVLAILVSSVVALASSGAGGLIGRFIGTVISFAGIICIYAVLFAYPVVFEMIWDGRTPGKRLLGIRVIRDGGYPINLLASCIRNIIKFIDYGIAPIPGGMLALMGFPGLVSMLVGKSYKRLGDFAAGTIVIVERGYAPLGIASDRADLSPAARFYLDYVYNLDRLTVDEYRIVRRFSTRRTELEPAVQAALGERLAVPLVQKLGIAPPIAYQIQHADLLDAIERKYAEEHGVL